MITHSRLTQGDPGAVVSRWVDVLTRRRCQVTKNSGGLCTSSATYLVEIDHGPIRYFYACGAHRDLQRGGNDPDAQDLLTRIRPGF